MTHSPSSRVRPLVASALFFALASLADLASALALPELMAVLAQRRGGEASFVEQRYVKGLDQPLRSTGTLSFVAPDRFTRSTLEPRAESVSVEGNAVTMKRGGRTRVLTLDAVPEAAAMVEAVRGTLTGNAATLQRLFRTALGGSTEQWVLDLTPIEVSLYNQVRIVRLMGRRADVLSVEVQLADGDRSVMAITPMVASTAPAPASAPRAAAPAASAP
jgi:Outer membrane lipoprotein carrier protein LolA-like